ncbi:unnamed protein product [Vicia faba]|uniref:Uncharacterized protein n=1 Tax=Vicia faba TaxID=3906 RepID=A0AAV1AXP5_VICFA|nr:unnamed protein product [Vicia faba]
MVSHLKTLYLCSGDEHKNTIREAIENNSIVFAAFEETLRGLEQWICRRYTRIHVMSWACHHPDGLVRVTLGTKEARSHIVGIAKPSTIDFDKLDANMGIVLVIKPQNRQDCRSGNQKALQQLHILECLTTWRDADGISKLVDSVLGSSEQEKLGHKGVHIDE